MRREPRLKELVSVGAVKWIAGWLEQADPPWSVRATPFTRVVGAIAWHLRVGRGLAEPDDWLAAVADCVRLIPALARLGPVRHPWPPALLDEFPQLGRLDFIEQGLAVCAGYGIRAVLVCQDEDQIRSIYGQHQSITANCGTICCIPGFSHESLDTVTRWGGERVQVTASKQRQVGVFRSPSLGEMESRIPVLNPRELLRRGREEVLVLIAGCAPTWLRKVRYDQERELKRMFDDAGCLAVASQPVVELTPPPDESAGDFDRNLELLR